MKITDMQSHIQTKTARLELLREFLQTLTKLSTPDAHWTKHRIKCWFLRLRQEVDEALERLEKI